MSLLRYENVTLTQDISDRTISDKDLGITLTEIPTKIKRRAELQTLIYSPRDRRVTINVTIHHYAAKADNTFGNCLDSIPGYAPYERSITAFYDALVDASTGQVVGGVDLLNDPSAALEGGPLYNITYMYEFEWYKQLAATQSVIIDNLISQSILVADSKGKLEL